MTCARCNKAECTKWCAQLPKPDAVTYGYRLYRAHEFCKLEVCLPTEWAARDGIREAFESGWYDRAEVTRNGEVIEELKK